MAVRLSLAWISIKKNLVEGFKLEVKGIYFLCIYVKWNGNITEDETLAEKK